MNSDKYFLSKEEIEKKKKETKIKVLKARMNVSDHKKKKGKKTHH